MRKTLFLTICAAFFVLLSCEKQPVDNTGGQNNSPIVFNLSATHPGGADTKAAIKADWEDGDAIFVFFSGATVPNYLKMTYNSATTPKWTSTEYSGDTATPGALSGIPASGTMRAVYLPFGSNAAAINYYGNFLFNIAACSYYFTATASYTMVGSEITGNFTMALPDGFMLFYYQDAAAADDMAELSVTDFLPTAIVGINPSSLDISEAQLSEGSAMTGFAYNGGYLFSGRYKTSSWNTTTTFDLLMSKGLAQMEAQTATTSINPVAGNSRTINITTLSAAGATNWTTSSKPMIVDLSLTVKWANRNLGATDTDLFGDYYAWGELAPYYQDGYSQEPTALWRTGKTGGYVWGSYSLANGAQNKLTKYCNNSDLGNGGYTDSRVVLETEDDVAQQSAALIGSGWRMPTIDDFIALNETKTNGALNWTWCDGSGTQYRGSTVKGWRIVNPYTNATLFLPAAGMRGGVSLSNVGSYGNYWSSSLYASDPSSARFFYFTSTGVSRSYYPRYNGLSVRPVRD